MAKITLLSFGFKYGVPKANYYFDVGFLKNPSRKKGWSFFDVPNKAMRDYVLKQREAAKFIEYVVPLLKFLATIDQNQIFAFGCSAGRHRSSVLVDEIGKVLEQEGLSVSIEHRDLDY